MRKGLTRSSNLALSVFASMFLLTATPAFAGFELDADGDEHAVVFNEATGIFTVRHVTDADDDGTNEVNTLRLFQWGLPGDYPVPDRYFQTGFSDIAVWRPTDGVWYIRRFNLNFTYNSANAFQWGLPTDTPHPCDINGDGLADLNIFRDAGGLWASRLSNTTEADTYSTAVLQQWGLPGDTPVMYDYDTDDECDYAVFRNGTWFIILSSASNTFASLEWGAAGDTPIPGHFDSDNILDFAVYRAGAAGGPLWIIRHSTIAGLTSTVLQWGAVGDQPVTLDVNGDDQSDICVFRASAGTWFCRLSPDYSTSSAFSLGETGDIAVGDRRGADPSS